MLKHEGIWGKNCQFGSKLGTRASKNKGAIESYFEMQMVPVSSGLHQLKKSIGKKQQEVEFLKTGIQN